MEQRQGAGRFKRDNGRKIIYHAIDFRTRLYQLTLKTMCSFVRRGIKKCQLTNFDGIMLAKKLDSKYAIVLKSIELIRKLKK